MKKVIFFALFFVVGSALFFLLSGVGILAQQDSKPDDRKATALLDVNYEAVNPGDDIKYIVKRLREKITLTIFSFSDSRKEQYYQKLSGIRLAELKYIVDRKDIANIQTASQRYFTTAGQLTEFVVSKDGLADRRGEVKQLLISHLPVVEELMGGYNDTTAEWRFLKHDADYLRIYIDKLSF